MQLCKQGNAEHQKQLSEEMWIYKSIPTNVYNKAKDEMMISGPRKPYKKIQQNST